MMAFIVSFNLVWDSYQPNVTGLQVVCKVFSYFQLEQANELLLLQTNYRKQKIIAERGHKVGSCGEKLERSS